MPYRNVVPSIVWTLVKARRRQAIEEESSVGASQTDAIWIPPDFQLNGAKSGGGGDLPQHTWRAGSGVSNR